MRADVKDVPFFEADSGALSDGVSPSSRGRVPLSQQALAGGGAQPARADYLTGLNAQQRAAVEYMDGPLLVLAGAGTGKTRVLTTRMAHILNTSRARSYQILAVTFTNKAAREMKERVERLLSDVAGEMGGGGDERHEGLPWVGTFHAIGARILRRHAELAELRPNFTILDADDQLRLLKQVIEAEGLDAKAHPPRQLAALIDGWKNKGLTPDKVSAGEAAGFAGGGGATLYAAYQARLKELNVVDFGDLLLESLRLFQNFPDILADYQQRFRYILVDEYQDTNIAQYLWLRLLAQGTRNICCVGDDDQSIYGWRGAEVDNILRFEQDFAGAKVIRLEQNYRSTGHILGAASGLIAHNRDRLGKTLFTEGADGDRVTVACMWDEAAEARSVGGDIEALQRAGVSANQIAVLVRASFQMRAFEDCFIALGLDYRVIGGPRFYERQEVKDAIAYFDVVQNEANDLRFERIVNTPKRGLGEASLRLLHAHARQQGVPLMAAARALCETEDLKPRARNALAGLLSYIDHWRAEAQHLPHTELAELILDESGYTQMWQRDKSPKAQSRLENLKELIRFMGEFDSMGDFLEHVSLVMDAETQGEGERVSLMTLHAAKGLEFDVVFLPGWEEGLFPHQRALDEVGRAGLEEERRLAYVGLTRARMQAKISFARNRRLRGWWQPSQPSRFVDELPPEHAVAVLLDEDGDGMGGASDTGWARYGRRGGYGAASMGRATGDGHGGHGGRGRTGPLIEARAIETEAATACDFALGERVFHLKFGYGQIAAIDANKLTIEFEKAGRKRVMASFVERH